MKVYISGPIAGAPGVSREEKLARFYRAALVLEEMGYEPFNPLDVEACPTQDCGGQWVEDEYRHDWECFLRYDLIAMLQVSDRIALLPEWELSNGARVELSVAQGLGWEVVDLSSNATVLGLPHAAPESL